MVASLEHDPTSNPGLNISADGRWFIFSIDDYRNFDIMLVEKLPLVFVDRRTATAVSGELLLHDWQREQDSFIIQGRSK
jgi:hypothetical protein